MTWSHIIIDRAARVLANHQHALDGAGCICGYITGGPKHQALMLADAGLLTIEARSVTATVNGPTHSELYAAILARLEAKSDHEYMWPRWAAADEAAHAARQLLVAGGEHVPRTNQEDDVTGEHVNRFAVVSLTEDEGCPNGFCVVDVVLFDHISEAHEYARTVPEWRFAHTVSARVKDDDE